MIGSNLERQLVEMMAHHKQSEESKKMQSQSGPSPGNLFKQKKK
jgi:hypothetical protein